MSNMMDGRLRDAIRNLAASGKEIYVAGGAVRDWLLGRTPLDIDLVMPDSSLETAERFARMTGGALVPLDEKEGVSRVVSGGFTIDFSRFRGRAGAIEEDLAERDFSINAMAMTLEDALPMILEQKTHVSEDASGSLIDPLDGRGALLTRKTIELASPHALSSDPLRILRAFRFAAQYGLAMTPDTETEIRKEACMAARPAPERINHELFLIMKTRSAGQAFEAMNTSGVLPVLMPEITELDGVEQPGFHHLDVLGHSLAALAAMDTLIKTPGCRFPDNRPFLEWISGNERLIVPLKWAALTHDFGKPRRKRLKGEKITFYNHDRESAGMVEALGRRLRWPLREIRFTTAMVRLHMRPFHLLGPFMQGRLTQKAVTRLLRKTGADYPALFLLAMSDSIAGCGPLKPPGLDEHLASLAMRVHHYFIKNFKPVTASPRLITGHDIMKRFNLPPGPVIGKLLRMVEDGMVEGLISSKSEAEHYIEKWMEDLT